MSRCVACPRPGRFPAPNHHTGTPTPSCAWHAVHPGRPHPLDGSNQAPGPLRDDSDGTPDAAVVTRRAPPACTAEVAHHWTDGEVVPVGGPRPAPG